MRTLALLAGTVLAVCSPALLAALETPAPSPAATNSAPPVDSAAMVRKAIGYLTSQQHASGGWNISDTRPAFPAISALALRGMMPSDPGTDVMKDPAIASGIRYLLSMQKPDGGIYDVVPSRSGGKPQPMLPSYNTAISVVTLARVNTPEAKEAVKKAVGFLRTLQFGEDAARYEEFGELDPNVAKDHPFYGGVGYGGSGRPDLSNTAWWMEAMHAGGVEPSDPAMQRALVFLQRVQMLEATTDPETGRTTPVNDMPYAKGSRQGGFVYATSLSKDKVGSGESKAPTIVESLSDGTVESRLRSYGSMTYSGFKSYLYAGLSTNDPRVTAAHDWIRRNYTLEENPGVGTDGLYYYYVVFARALAARGEPTITPLIPRPTTGANTVSSIATPGPGIDKTTEAWAEGEPRSWSADLAARLATLQQPDGSFKPVDDRWMENDPVLITAYSLCALREAGK